MPRTPYGRKRWASYSATDKRRNELRAQARARIEKMVDLKDVPKIVGLHVIRGLDLRATLEEKSVSVHALAKWTAFVNRAGTLAHILPREGDFHIRLPLYYSTITMSDQRLAALLWDHVEGRLK